MQTCFVYAVARISQMGTRAHVSTVQLLEIFRCVHRRLCDPQQYLTLLPVFHTQGECTHKLQWYGALPCPPHLHVYSWGNKSSFLILTGITSSHVSRAPTQLNAKQDSEWPLLSTSVSEMLEVIQCFQYSMVRVAGSRKSCSCLLCREVLKVPFFQESLHRGIQASHRVKRRMSTAGEIQTLGFSLRDAHLVTFLKSLPAYCGTAITKGVLLCIHLFQLILLKPGLNRKK